MKIIMEMPVPCSHCGEIVELNDCRTAPCKEELVCRACYDELDQQKELEDNCDKCGEQLDQCEGCENKACSICDDDYWRHDSEGVKLCPDCYAALQEEYNRETNNGQRVCGSCAHFENEDIDGDGDCSEELGPKNCRDYCYDSYKPREK